MSGTINRVPLGLLDLLDMKARGQAPRFLAGEVSGSLELMPLYLLQDREHDQDNAVATGAGGTLSMTGVVVPQGEVWYVHRVVAYSSGVLTGAGVTLRIRLGWFFNPGQRGFSIGDASITGGQGDQVVADSREGFWATGGDLPLVFIEEYTAGAPDPTIEVDVQFTRLAV